MAREKYGNDQNIGSRQAGFSVAPACTALPNLLKFMRRIGATDKTMEESRR
ncbi:MAG: hypothetical protein AB7C89_09215 [Intestinibacillus sp.]